MSLHRSLKTTSGALNQHRNVLTRAERVQRLTARDRFDPERDTPIGLPKVANRKVAAGKKKKTDDDEKTAEVAEKPAEKGKK